MKTAHRHHAVRNEFLALLNGDSFRELIEKNHLGFGVGPFCGAVVDAWGIRLVLHPRNGLLDAEPLLVEDHRLVVMRTPPGHARQRGLLLLTDRLPNAFKGQQQYEYTRQGAPAVRNSEKRVVLSWLYYSKHK